MGKVTGGNAGNEMGTQASCANIMMEYKSSLVNLHENKNKLG